MAELSHVFQSESSSEEVNALRAEVTSLKKSLGDRDATIAGLKEEVVQLKAKIELLEAEAVKGEESNEVSVFTPIKGKNFGRLNNMG